MTPSGPQICVIRGTSASIAAPGLAAARLACAVMYLPSSPRPSPARPRHLSVSVLAERRPKAAHLTSVRLARPVCQTPHPRPDRGGGSGHALVGRIGLKIAAPLGQDAPLAHPHRLVTLAC